MKPLKTCSHRALGWEGAKNSGFSRLLLQAPKNMLSQGSHFTKWFTKTASAPPVKLFVKLKKKKWLHFTQTGP